MIRAPLHVEQRHPARPHQVDEGHQRDLRRVPLGVKHRFAGEESVDADAVQPSSQLTITVERLDAVRPVNHVCSRLH